MRIPRPIRLGSVDNSEAAVQRAVDLIREGRTTEGSETAEFERELAAAMGYRYAVACSSGTAALWLIMAQMPRGAVTTTPLTFAATANAPESLGFAVRYRDVSPDNYGLDRRALTADDAHAVVLTVHLLGYPSDVRGDVSDACEAVGSVLPKPNCATAVSFYPSHTIGVGELGAVLTDDPVINWHCMLAKDNGRCKRATEPFRRLRLGLNLKASEVTCALARFQLRKMGAIVRARQENARAYFDMVGGGPFDRRCAYLGYPVVYRSPEDRAMAASRLRKTNVEYRYMFPLLGGEDSCPKASHISKCGLYVPCHQGLSDADVHRVAGAL